MKLNRFAKYTWGVLALNLAVILWGAYVRASGSGAGCGSHWPLCNGVVIPRSPQIETIVEFTHRLSSGLSLVLVVGMLVWAFRSYPKGDKVRLGASLSMFFIITEALVGAGLVLFQWVAQDASLGRAISIGIHLVNTFLLLASITLTAWWASGGAGIQFNSHSLIVWGLALGLLGVMLIGVSGALTALGDTLFPAKSLAEGFSQDFSPTANFLIRLRILHPTIAISVGIYLLLVSSLVRFRPYTPLAKTFARALTALVVVQIFAGFLNVFLLAPIWMQIVHLLLADSVWITLVLMAATTLTEGLAPETVQSAQPSATYADTHRVA
jgi:heme A synthase